MMRNEKSAHMRKTSHPTSDSTNSAGENSSRSLIFSPTPTNRAARFSYRAIATAMLPLAVPSSWVSTIPVTPAASVNSRLLPGWRDVPCSGKVICPECVKRGKMAR